MDMLFIAIVFWAFVGLEALSTGILSRETSVPKKSLWETIKILASGAFFGFYATSRVVSKLK